MNMRVSRLLSLRCFTLFVCAGTIAAAASGSAADTVERGGWSAATPPHHRHDGGLEPLATPNARAPDIATGAGLHVILDPQTLEPISAPATPQQAEQIREQALQQTHPDFSRMQVETMDDGRVVLHTNGQLMMRVSVQRRADGSFEETCAPGAIQSPTPTPTPPAPTPAPTRSMSIGTQP